MSFILFYKLSPHRKNGSTHNDNFFRCRFQECAKYMSSEQISHFLDAAIRNRIAVRLIAEQHIVLSRALQNPERADAADVGIVDKALSPVEMIRMCGSFVTELCEATLGAAPPIVIDGATDATFACVISLSLLFVSSFPIHTRDAPLILLLLLFISTDPN